MAWQVTDQKTDSVWGCWLLLFKQCVSETTYSPFIPMNVPKEENFSILSDVSKKRTDYINWEDYFMATAFLASKRSKDPVRQVGACIVNEDNKIVGVGYNGFPTGCDDDDFPWEKHNRSALDNKYFYVCHAEMNAILNRTSNKKGCRIYVTLFPCNECVKLIIQSGINEVIYISDKNFNKPEIIAAKKMLDAVKITYRQLVPKHKKIIIDFDEVNCKAMFQLKSSPKKPQEDETTEFSN